MKEGIVGGRRVAFELINQSRALALHLRSVFYPIPTKDASSFTEAEAPWVFFARMSLTLNWRECPVSVTIGVNQAILPFAV